MVDECCICLEPLEKNIHFLICGHSIHKECWSFLLDRSICPICQTKQIDYSEKFLSEDQPLVTNLPLASNNQQITNIKYIPLHELESEQTVECCCCIIS